MARYRYFSAVLIVFFLGCTAVVVSQRLSVDFRQAANNDRNYTQGDVHWVQSILQQNNSAYFEGMSVPQRIMLSSIPSTATNQHALTFRHLATKGGKHAYDYLTSYDQALTASTAIGGPTVLVNLNECGDDFGPPKNMQSTCAAIHAGPYHITADLPDAMGSTLSHSIASSVGSYEAQFGNRTLTIYGNMPILSANVVFNGYSTGRDVYAEYTVMWTSASSSILIEMAGHLSLGVDVPTAGTGIGYGSGLGAGSINGAPFHFKLDQLDGKALGSRDNQISGNAIRQRISCDISGPDPACAGSQNTYTFNTNLRGLQYSWALSNNSSGAAIVGSSTGQSVIVDAGSATGSFELIATVTDGAQTVTCPLPVNVTGLSVTCSYTPIACFGDNSTVTVDVSGGTSPYTGAGTFRLPAGTHSFTVTDANGCAGTTSITITEPTQLTATAIAAQGSCSSSSQTVTVTASGGTPPYTGTGTFNCGTGPQTFLVTDANGCRTNATLAAARVMQFTATASATPILCNGGTSTVTVSAFGGTPPYTGTGTFTRTAGTYNFTVTDANNCSGVATITITQPAQQIAVTASPTQIDCYGGNSTVTVSAVGGTPPYSGTGSYSRTAGTYTFTVTDANNCSGSTTLTISQPTQQLAVTASPTQINCNGGNSTVTVSATGGTPPYTGTGTYTRTAGTYTFAVTDANNCSASTTVTISQPAQQLSAAASATPLTCSSSNSTVTVTATGGTAPYTGTGTYTRTAGTYTFAVSDANGCTTNTSVTIAALQQLIASASATPILCNGGNSTVTVTATGGTAPYTGTGTFTRTAGTYTFTVTDANNCSGSTTISISQPAQPIAVTASPTQIACNGGNSTVTVSATGGTPPYQGTGTYSHTAGTYTFTVTDANNCSGSTTITISQPAQSITVSASPTQIDCHGGSSNVTVSATGGTPPYQGTGTFSRTAGTYTFTVTDANNCSGSTTITISQPAQQLSVTASASTILCNGGNSTVTVAATGGTAPYTGTGTFTRTAGTYSFTVTDDNGCTASASVTISQPAQQLAVTASATPILCNGDNSTVTVTATGGTPPYAGTGTFTHTAGTYSFTVTDANGCTGSASVTITQPAQALVASASATPLTCSVTSSTVTVTATGGTAPYGGTGNFTRTAGTYTFTVTDANNCSSTVSVTVSGPTQLNATASATPILCNGGNSTVTVSANGGTAPYSGVGTFSQPAGTYTYTVTDANNCTATASVTISEPPQLTAFADGTPILCNGGNSDVTVSATGGTSPYTGTGTYTYTAGTYNFTVTDANGCTASTSLVITEPGTLSIAANASQILCNGGNSNVVVTATGGTSPYTGTGTISLPAGTHTITVTDANGCTASTTIAITEPPLLHALSSATPVLCYGDFSTVTVTASGGTPPITGTGVFNATAGTYTFTVTDYNGCTANTTVTITEPPELVASILAPQILCYGGSSVLVVSAAGGTSPYQGTGSFSRTAGTYSFIVTDANGCADTVMATLTNPPLLTATATATTILCNGDDATVTVTGTGGTPPYIGIGTFVRPAGSYTFTVTDANGCTAQAPITISQPPLLVASSSAPPLTCGRDSVNITVTAIGGTQPYTGTGTFRRGLGSYSFVVTDTNGCTSTTIVSVTGPPALIASAIPTPILCHGGTSTVTVGAQGGVPPYNGVGTFTETAGTYTYIVTDANGCGDTVTIIITEPPPLVASVTATPIQCNGESSTVTVTASGGTPQYNGVGTFSRTAGSYTFTVTDANGCTDDVSIVITEPTPLVASATYTPVLCGRDSSTVTVTATGGMPPYTGTGTFRRPTGTHTFTVIDTNGCSTMVTVTIGGPRPVNAYATWTPILCNGGNSTVTITASGGRAPYTGVGQFTRGAGTYTFTVTDSSGCHDTVQVIITQPPPLTVNCAISSCENGMRIISATPSGGTPPYTYLWTPGNYTTRTLMVPCSFTGLVTVVVRDANWNINDPNRSSCEATCSLNIMVKRGEKQPDIALSTTFCTQDALPGPDGIFGTTDDVPDPGMDGINGTSDDPVHSHYLPASVFAALKNAGLPQTVEGLMVLSNLASNGLPVNGSTNGEIAIAVQTVLDAMNSNSIIVDCLNRSSDPGQSSAGEYALFENYPNPFNPSTTIRYQLPEASHVRLFIVNTVGKTITTLVDEEMQAGTHLANWNANNMHGQRVPSGSYFYRIQATSLSSGRQFVSERLMLLLK